MADEITDAEIARFAGAVKEAEERDAAGRARGAVVATARFGRGLLARLERAEKDAEESYLRGKTDGANEEHSLNWQRENSRIATLERELSRWRGCEQVEGDYVCKHEFECSQILRPRIATLEAQRDEYAEQYGVMGVALTVAERKLSAYVGVCAGDKELTESVLPKVRSALRALEDKP